jgi:hypothetical protein
MGPGAFGQTLTFEPATGGRSAAGRNRDRD